MKTVTDNFKTDLTTYGRQFDVKVYVDDEQIDTDNFNSIVPSFNTDLFKTVMHQLELDSNISMISGTKIEIEFGIKLNEASYEYIEFKTYYVSSCERQEDTNSYRILAYTKMQEAMVDYDLVSTEKVTLRQYLINICNRLEWDTSNIPDTFINSETLVDPSLHEDIDYTFRDALDEIATISCSFILFKNDELYLMYITETGETIDETYLDEDNVTIGEKYIINSLVFSRAEESDNIYRKDTASIAVNGLHEYRISDCQLLSTNDRSDYIDEMFDYLKTFEFYIFDVQSKGILFFEACDRFTFYLNEVSYSVILLNDEISIEDGIAESLYIEEPEETETEYKYADSTDKKINQTYILVDKQNQKITSVVEEVDSQNEKISQVTQTVNELSQAISDIADITTSESGYGSVSLSGVNESEPIEVIIRPTSSCDVSYLYPNTGLYPSSTLYPLSRTLRFETTDGYVLDWLIPDDLLYYDEDNYDELTLNYDTQTLSITKKVGYNADGSKYLLDEAVTTTYDYPILALESGDYTVTLLGYSLAYLFVRLMAQNIYTTQFATKIELNSSITQTVDSITSTVSAQYATLSNLDTAVTDLESSIKQTSTSILSTVSATYATKTSVTASLELKVDTANLISEINASADTISLTARQINNNGRKFSIR